MAARSRTGCVLGPERERTNVKEDMRRGQVSEREWTRREGSEQNGRPIWRSRPRANHRWIEKAAGRRASPGGVNEREQCRTFAVRGEWSGPCRATGRCVRVRPLCMPPIARRPGRAPCVGGRWPTGAGARQGTAGRGQRGGGKAAGGKEVWSRPPAGMGRGRSWVNHVICPSGAGFEAVPVGRGFGDGRNCRASLPARPCRPRSSRDRDRSFTHGSQTFSAVRVSARSSDAGKLS